MRKIYSVFAYVVVFAILFAGNAVFAVSNATAKATISPTNKFCVVLDAGHGGIDKGCTGQFCNERDINLAITQKLGSMLQNMNINVVYTRTNDDGLYGTFASGFKRRDMKARENIIKQAKPNLVVSIHLNSYSDKSAHGAQCFYAQNSEISSELGQEIQNLFVKQLSSPRLQSLPGDYYILNCTATPGVLCECGFLSNSEEEKLLATSEYQDKIAYCIACGIISFFGIEN